MKGIGHRLLVLSLLTLSLSASSVLAKRPQARPLQLVKTQMLYYRLPSASNSETPRIPMIFSMDPRFYVFRNGNSVLLDADSEILFFDYFQNLIAVTGQIGRLPGKFIGKCKCITPTLDDHIVGTDGSGRFNVWDSRGTLLQSLIMPDFNVIYDEVCILGDTIIVSGAFFSDSAQMLAVKLYDPRRAMYMSTVHAVNIDSSSLVERKGAGPVARAFFLLTDKRLLLCNASVNADIVTLDLRRGTKSRQSGLPLNYGSLAKAGECDIKKLFEAKSNEERSRLMDTWSDTWSWSACPTLYSDTIVIVRRRMVPPEHLDFYSLKDGTYIGQYSSEKRFLYSDSKWIYFCEDVDDTLLTVGRYGLVTDAKSAVKSSIIYYEKPPQNLLDEHDRETAAAREPPISLAHASISLPDGNPLNLLSQLPEGYDHLLVFFSPFDCGVPQLIEASKAFVKDYGTFDFHLVITHSDPSDLRTYAEGVALMYRVPTLMNTDRTKLSEMGALIQPAIVVINKEGKVLGVHSRLYNSDQPLDVFLRDLGEGGN